MYRKTFVYFCRRTLTPMQAIFTAVHSVSNVNNIYKFHNIWRIFMRLRACIDGRTDKQTESINSFQLYRKTLVILKKKKKKHNSTKNSLPVISRHRTTYLQSFARSCTWKVKTSNAIFIATIFLNVWMTRVNFILFSSMQTY